MSVLKHDLSIEPADWEQWLKHLHQYHLSRFPYPTPIQRPSSFDPITTVRKVLEALIGARAPVNDRGEIYTPPHPVFCPLPVVIGKKAKPRRETVDMFGFDLDEDGPLREEYALRRSCRPVLVKEGVQEGIWGSINPSHSTATHLPPPSEWSPQGDPPLSRGHGQQLLPSSVSDHSPTQLPFIESSTQPTWGMPYGPPCTQAIAKTAGSELAYQPSAITFSLAPICLPVSHARSTLVPAIPLHAVPGHYRSYSHSYANGSEFYYPTPACSFYEGYSSAASHTNSNFGHFRPLWLRT